MKINLDLYPFSIMLPIIFIPLLVISILISFKVSKEVGTKIFKIIFALNYFFIGFVLLYATMHLSFLFNFLGTIFTWTISILLIIDLKRKKINLQEFNFEFKNILSYILILTGILIYPLIQMAMGFFWPKVILFGIGECPTTIFLIGILILSNPTTNKCILGLSSITGVFVGIVLGISGIFVDFLYMIAGIIGILYLIKIKYNT